MTRPKPYCPPLFPLPIDPLHDGPCDSCDTRRLLNSLTGILPTHCTAFDYRYSSPNGDSLSVRVAHKHSDLPRHTVHRSLFTAHWTYTFSAKERDPETGLSYFGSRYYSSDLSIWLSVDPQSDKYPSLSPYVYCADNPVKLVDPNGEDYEVVIDDQSKTITIKATYYVTKDTKEGMEMAFNYFTCQEQNLSYTMDDGENYSVRFDLSIAGEYDTWEKAYDAMSKSGDKFANLCMSGNTQDPGNGRPAMGQTQEGKYITINPNHILSYRTYAHEIGHTLGFSEWSSELMKSRDSHRYDMGLCNEYIQQSMIRITTDRTTPAVVLSPLGRVEKTSWSNIGIGYIKTNK